MRKTADKSVWNKDLKLGTYSSLDENIECDVLIVGGGVTGALTAFMFDKIGVKCVVIEKENIASGSTSASTSILHYELDSDLRMLRSLIDDEHANEAFKMTLDAVYQLDNIVRHLEDDCEFERRPSLYYTTKDNKYDYMLKEYETRKEQHYEVEFLEKENEKYGFPLCAGILTYNSGATINPVKLTNEVLKYCHKNNTQVFEQTEAIEFDIQDDKVNIITNHGHKITCKKVVMTGYDSLNYFDENFYTISRTFSLATKQVENFDGWFSQSIIKNDEDPYLYLRTTKDGRIIIGGEDIDVSDNDEDKFEMMDDHPIAKFKYSLLEKKLEEMFPLIQGKDIEFRFNGIFIDSDDGLPYIGGVEEYPNFYFNIGIGSNGVLNGLIGANLLSRLYSGETVRELEIFKFGR